MDDYICDDREISKDLEELYKIKNMTDEEFEKYLKESENENTMRQN